MSRNQRDSSLLLNEPSDEHDFGDEEYNDEDVLDSHIDSTWGSEGGTLHRNTFAQWLLMAVFLIFLTSEILFRRATTYVAMPNYTVFLNMVLVVSCSVLFCVCLVVFRVPFPNRELLAWFVLISLFDTVAFMAVLIASSYVSAPVSALLMQGVIPASMIFSYILLSRKFKWQHYTGALFILGAIAVTVIFPTEVDHIGIPTTQSDAFWWGFVHVAANIPSSLASVCKEITLGHHDPKRRANLHALNAYVAMFQIVFSLMLSPLSYYFTQMKYHEDKETFTDNFYHGFRCLFMGINQFAEDECSRAWIYVSLHVLATTVVNILALMVIFHGSAVIFFVSSASTIPLTHLISMASFMGRLKVEPNGMDVLAICLCIMGLVIYRSKQEI